MAQITKRQEFLIYGLYSTVLFISFESCYITYTKSNWNNLRMKKWLWRRSDSVSNLAINWTSFFFFIFHFSMKITQISNENELFWYRHKCNSFNVVFFPASFIVCAEHIGNQHFLQSMLGPFQEYFTRKMKTNFRIVIMLNGMRWWKIQTKLNDLFEP